MFKALRAAVAALLLLPDAINSVALAVHEVGGRDGSDAALAERVRLLEVNLEMQLAEASALMVKAGSLKAAARASEERERKLAAAATRSAEVDDEELTSEELQRAYADAGIQLVHAGGGPEGEVPAVSEPLAETRRGKDAARAKKWGYA